jgi:hypothetical protein
MLSPLFSTKSPNPSVLAWNLWQHPPVLACQDTLDAQSVGRFETFTTPLSSRTVGNDHVVLYFYFTVN